LSESLNASEFGTGNLEGVRSSKIHAALPIGRTAKIAYELDLVRAGCSHAAAVLADQSPVDEAELEECARLDDAVAHAQRVMKAAVRSIMLSRLTRNSRTAQ
jgi:hypothetical protein